MRTGNLGTRLVRMGDLSKAIEYHRQDLATAKKVRNRPGRDANIYTQTHTHTLDLAA